MKKFIPFLLFVLTVAAHAQESFTLYFASNQYVLDKKETARLHDFLTTHADCKIIAMNGYTDEDGSTGFNDTLARRRIDHVASAVKGKILLRDDCKTRSFGESVQASKIKAENRRVTIYYLLPKDLPREDEILGIRKPEPPKPTVPKPLKFPPKLTIDNPNGTQTTMVLDTVFMQKVNLARAGEKLQMKDLNFQINTFIVVPESVPRMFELLLVLQQNPNLKIQVQGHLCCMPSDKQDLSSKRAKAIYNFLVDYGIAKERLSYKGFGSTVPLFPIPEKDESQRAANRRVEIEILSN